MIISEVTCNNCNRNISKTGNSIDYRLRLSDERIPCHDGAVTDMMLCPSLKNGDCHFCGLGCLKVWALTL